MFAKAMGQTEQGWEPAQPPLPLFWHLDFIIPSARRHGHLQLEGNPKNTSVLLTAAQEIPVPETVSAKASTAGHGFSSGLDSLVQISDISSRALSTSLALSQGVML